jgi:hypothetical protein
MNSHEDYSRPHGAQSSSNRNFGLIFAAFFAFLALWPYVHSGRTDRLWALVCSSAFLIVALTWATLLEPLNRLWTKLAWLLSKITTPLLTGLLFYLVITPVALVLRFQRKDLLRLKLDASAKSYWIIRQPPGPSGDSMANQF